MRVMDLQEVKTLKTGRCQLQKVKAYLTGENERVCVLYGLCRTGKTTLSVLTIGQGKLGRRNLEVWMIALDGFCPTPGKVSNYALSFDDSSWYNTFMYKSIA